MSFLFMESFDSYSVASDLAAKWGAWDPFCSFGVGRGGTGKASNGWKAVFFPTSTLVGVGAAIRWDGSGIGTVGVGGPSSWTVRATLDCDSEGRLGLTASANGTKYSDASPPVLTRDEWYFIEFYAINMGMGGISMSVRVNGEDVLSASVLFGGTWPMGFNCFRLEGGWQDDVYLATGSYFLGDLRLATLRPNEDGSLSEWEPSVPGSPHYQMVRNLENNVYTMDLEKTDMWGFDDLSPGLPAKVVNAVLRASSSPDSTTTIVPTFLISGELVEWYPVEMDANVRNIVCSMVVNPVTGTYFNTSQINDMQVGARRIL
jgi:hypothetical protein